MESPLHTVPFLVGAPGRDPADTVAGCVPADQLDRVVIIRDEAAECSSVGGYRVFANWAAYWAWAEKVPNAQRRHHEVVPANFPRRYVVDVDADREKLEAIPQSELISIGFEPGELAEFAAESSAAHRVNLQLADALAEKIADFASDAISSVLWDKGITAIGSEDFAVFTSSSEETGTYSYHILLPGYVLAGGSVDGAFVTARLVEDLENAGCPNIAALIDTGIDRKNGNLRLPLAVKGGRMKRILRAPESMERGLSVETAQDPSAYVLRPDDTTPGERPIELPRLVERTERGNAGANVIGTGTGTGSSGFTEEDVAAIRALPAVRELETSHSLRNVSGRILVYNRRKPTDCGLCGRRHDKDNTVYLVASRALAEAEADPIAVANAEVAAVGSPKALHAIYERCFKAKQPDARTLLGFAAISPANFDEFVAEVEAEVANQPPATPGTGAAAAPGTGAAAPRRHVPWSPQAKVAAGVGRTAATRGCGLTLESLGPGGVLDVYESDEMRPYPVPAEGDTLIIRAGMGLGKTKALGEWLTAYYPQPEANALYEPVLVALTARTSLAAGLKVRLGAGFERYDEIGTPGISLVAHPRLVVQAESLRRIRPGADTPDLVIIDEVESVVAQLDSGLHRDFARSFAVLSWLMRTAKTVICLDANAGPRTLAFLRALRPAGRVHAIVNRKLVAAGRTFRVTDDHGKWLAHLADRLDNGKRGAVPTSSLAEAKGIERWARTRWPHLNIYLYSSETSPSIRRTHFADVGRHWGNLDLLIYTPTVSAGVSFELEHFDFIAAYFSSRSCPVEDCRQMLGRVRNLGDNELLVCMSSRPAAYPATPGAVRAAVSRGRARLSAVGHQGGQVAAPYWLDFADAGGAPEVHGSPYFEIWVANQVVSNLSRNDFAGRFISQVGATGATVSVLSSWPPGYPSKAAAAELTTLFKQGREVLADEEAAELAGARALTEGEADQVAAATSDPARDVPAEDVLALRKFRVARGYRIEPADPRLGKPGFVKAYAAAKVRRAYNALRTISSNPRGIRAALSDLHAERLELYRAAVLRVGLNDIGLPAGGPNGAPMPYLDAAAGEYRDLHTRPEWETHEMAVWFLGVFGFQCVTDRSFVHAAEAGARAAGRLPEMLARAKAAAALLGHAPVDEMAIRRAAGSGGLNECMELALAAAAIANKTITPLYGRRIASVKRGSPELVLRKTPVGRLLPLRSELANEEGDDTADGPIIVPSVLPPPPGTGPGATAKRILDLWFYSPEVQEILTTEE